MAAANAGPEWRRAMRSNVSRVISHRLSILCAVPDISARYIQRWARFLSIYTSPDDISKPSYRHFALPLLRGVSV